MDLRERLDEVTARLAEKARSSGRKPPAEGGPVLPEDYWQRVQELFTRDVTEKGLRELVESDARETFRFFTREVDLSSLKTRPWYKRYPLAAFHVFEAMAYRLPPARRILFAAAVPLLLFGWVHFVLFTLPRARSFPPISSWEAWSLLGSSALFVLLVLELKDKLSLKGDLEVARQIQFGLLPFEPVVTAGLAVHASMRPANTVGGDYFDVIDLGAGKLAVVIGDVAGKGMPAALLMALLQGSLRTLITAGLRGAELIARLNDHLCINIPPNRLITLFYGEVDPREGLLHYVNAGHNPPVFLRRDGTLETLSATAVALGIVPDASFQAMETPFDPGDRLVLYTDGITEAMNLRDEEYGDARLAAFLGARRDSSQREVIEALLADVLVFCGAARPRDDMTLLALEREPAAL